MSEPVESALQDPLPESNWLWRRIFSFAVTVCCLLMLWRGLERMAAVAVLDPERGIPALSDFSFWLLCVLSLVVTYYMVAPSAEQITKMAKTATLLRSGVQIAARAIQREDGSAEQAKTVGLPPAPPTPPMGAEAQIDEFGNVRPGTPPPREVTSGKPVLE